MPRLDLRAVLFSFNSYLAAVAALFIALHIGLPRPAWAMATAYIVSQPMAGAVRSKALYRLVGTVIGGAASVAMVPNLVNAPPLLCLAIGLWVAGCLAVSLLDRTPRSYLMMLAGYTAAIIGFSCVNQPETIFEVTIARVEEIGLGIICATLAHSLIFPQAVGHTLRARVNDWLGEADRWLLDLLEGRSPAAADRDRRHLATAASEIRLLAVHLPFDTSHLRDTSLAVQAVHERMLLLVPLLSGVADRLAALGGAAPEDVAADVARVTAWLRAGSDAAEGARLAARLRQAAAAHREADWRDLLAETLLVRLSEAVAALADAHGLADHLDDPHAPTTPRVAAAMSAAVRRPMHRDLALAIRSGAATLVATLVTCALWIGTGWADGAVAAMMAAVFCAMFAALDDPAPVIADFGVYMFAGVPLAGLYIVGILPQLDGFPLLAASLFPPLFVMGLYLATPRHALKAVATALAFCSGLALQERFEPDLSAFLSSNLAQFVGVGIAVVATRVMRSISADASVRRLLRRTWAGIGQMARRGASVEPGDFAARLLDRIALVVPKLSDSAERDAVAESALRDLRVSMSLMTLREARAGLDSRAQLQIDRIGDRLADHYARRRDPAGAPAPAELLDELDTALAGVIGRADEDRRAVVGLVGLRRNLFPGAPAFTPAIAAA